MNRTLGTELLIRVGLLVAALFLFQSNGPRARAADEMKSEAVETLKAGQKIGQLTIPEGVVVLPDIAYRKGHERWKLDLAMPVEMGNEPRPGIVFVHGGGWRGGDKRRANFLGPALDFTANGYVCISTNYRLLSHAPFPACVEDVKCAVRWLRAHANDYNLDPNHIGAYGNSAGAHLVAMLGLCPASAGLEGDGPWQEYSSMVQAVVCSATPSNFLVPMNDRVRPQPPSSGPQERSRGRIGGNFSDEMRKKMSPITYVSADAPPFMIVHDTSDRTVAVRHGDDLHKALKDAGAKVVTYLRYDDGYGHGVWGGNAAALGPAREIFFARHLKKVGQRVSSRPSGRRNTQRQEQF